jgi:hypothetical protein
MEQLAYVRCPYCDQRINLFAKKDFESYSFIEAYCHYRARHPEMFPEKGFGMPYTPVQFEAANGG